MYYVILSDPKTRRSDTLATPRTYTQALERAQREQAALDDNPNLGEPAIVYIVLPNGREVDPFGSDRVYHI